MWNCCGSRKGKPPEDGDRPLEIVGLEVAEQGQAMPKNVVVADAGGAQRRGHLRPDLVMTLLVFLLVAGPDFEDPGIAGHFFTS
jgi:hypothetical protein